MPNGYEIREPVLRVQNVSLKLGGNQIRHRVGLSDADAAGMDGGVRGHGRVRVAGGEHRIER